MIDPTKRYRTRDGGEARVYATDGSPPYSVHGALSLDGAWREDTWDAGGKTIAGHESPRDLIEVREKLTVSGHVNIYRINGDATLLRSVIHRTREDAIYARRNSPDAIACRPVTIEFEEGDGL